jgi:hypothetical protein
MPHLGIFRQNAMLKQRRAPVVYLDTNHLSDLVRKPTAPGSVAVREMFAGGVARLALSFMHVIELSANVPYSPAIRRYADSCNPLFGRSMLDLFSAEADSAWRGARGQPRVDIETFVATVGDWAHDVRAGERTLPFTEFFGRHPEYRNDYRAQMELVAEEYRGRAKSSGSMPGRELGPLPRIVRMRRPVDADVSTLSAIDVIDRAGGLSAFPAFHCQHALLLSKLEIPSAIITVNDLVDFYHAIYAPYAAVAVLEHRHIELLRQRGLGHIARMTADLAEVPALLAAPSP